MRKHNNHRNSSCIGKKKGVECRSLMGGDITSQPAYKHLHHDGLVNAHELSIRSFFVGMHQTLAHDDVKEMAKILNDTFNQLSHQSASSSFKGL